MKKLFFITFVFCYACGVSQEIPAFKQLRYEEEYSFLKNDSTWDWYEKMKFSPLSRNREAFLSFGGEARFQYFYTKNEGWGDVPKDDDGYVLIRYLFHADLHAGKYFRAFVQLQSSVSGSRINASPVEDNPLDLHQAFIDINSNPLRQPKITLRIGRQEFLYGSQRLVSVRDGPNNRHSFDAIKSMVNSGNYRLDLFYGHYVSAQKGVFDDGFNKDTKFWGTYVVRNKVPVLRNIDLYYLGLWKRNAAFNDGMGKELRHSIGGRFWGRINSWQYDAEALYQFGKFAGKNISAWTGSLNASYQFNSSKLKPELGLKTEWISGDQQTGDDKLQTFNPLFPRGAYFGLAALIGPSNLIDIHPSLSLSLSKKIIFDVDYDIFWRYSQHDGIYAANVSLIYPDANTDEKHIGRQLTGSITFRSVNFLYFRSEFTWFDAGDYLKIAGTGKDILFTGITGQLKF
jgi:hypothetical protein